ncbi:MAG: hypothetical protein IJV07_02910 [Alphaproteobacteria bacterium]|nr:hypothetical protein [Alphaproteobacteria bacterium]
MKIQATSIAIGNRAYLITGPSGFGKSSLALSLIRNGAYLISDDVTIVDDQVAYAPKDYRGWLEVRGVGLISGFPVCAKALIAGIIELVPSKPDRIPSDENRQIGNQKFPLFRIWNRDMNGADKVMVIDRMIQGKLRKE